MNTRKSNHSPGPWRYEPDDKGAIIIDREGNDVCEVSLLIKRDLGLDGAESLQNANALLIASAPELLSIAINSEASIKRRDEKLASLQSENDALCLAATRVMELLEEHGANIVDHLLDTDENAGQELRDLLAISTKRNNNTLGA